MEWSILGCFTLTGEGSERNVMSTDKRIPWGKHAGKEPKDLPLEELVKLVNSRASSDWPDSRKDIAQELISYGWPIQKIRHFEEVLTPEQYQVWKASQPKPAPTPPPPPPAVQPKMFQAWETPPAKAA